MAGVEGSTPRRVTVPLELTLAVKERGRAQLEGRRTSAAMSGKVAAMVSQSGWGAWVCLGAWNLRAAAGREGVLVGEEEGEEDEARVATPTGEAFLEPFFLEEEEEATAA